MTKVTADDNKVFITFYNLPPDLFVAMNAALKQEKCTLVKSKRAWTCSILKYDDRIKDIIDDMDEVIEDEKALQALREGKPDLVISPERIMPDFDYLKTGPLEGKPPNENFQRVGITQGINRNRFGYFWGMGTGKTYVMAALIAEYYLKRKTVNKIMIVSSSIGIRNVLQELKHFIKDFPEDNKIYFADKDNREPFKKEYDIVLTNYNSFRLVNNHYRKILKVDALKPRKPFMPIEEWIGENGNGMLLLDESHEVANHSSYQGYYMALHSSLFEYRYLFTGTFADKPEKMYNQMKILDPYLVHNLSYQEWLTVYARIGTRYSRWGISSWRKDKLEEINKILAARYSSFKETNEVLDLPPHYRKVITVDMKPRHRELYERIIEEDLEELKTVRDVVNRFPYMMLTLDNPKLMEKHKDKFSLPTQTLLAKIKDKDLIKLDVVDEIVEERVGEKGILWVEHPVTAETLKERFKKYNPLVITGKTPDDQRKEIIDAFKSKKKHQLLIANIKVLNTSVTITEATYQVYVELIFSYVPYEQSSKRIYRHGQNKPVTTYIILHNNSLDFLRIKNLDSKGMLVRGLLKKDFLSQSEWIKIFNATDDNLDMLDF